MLISPLRFTQRWPWLGVSAFMVTYFLGAELGHRLSFPQEAFATFWPPNGLYLAALLLTPRRQWLALFLAALPANFVSDVTFHQQPITLSLSFWLINSIEVSLGACLIRWWVPDFQGLETLRELLSFLVVGVFLSPLVGATLGTIALGHTLPEPAWGQHWVVWWSSDALGILLVTPLVCIGLRSATPRWAWWRLIEATALGLGLLLVTDLIFDQQRTQAQAFLAFPYWLVPFLLWAAVRFELPGAVSAVFGVALLVVNHTTRGQGPFAMYGQTLLQQTLLIQTYLAVIALMTLLLAATTQRRRQLEQALQLRAQALAHAEQQAQRQGNLLQSILDSMAEAVVAIDPTGQFQLFNRAALQLHGLPHRPFGLAHGSQPYQLFLPDQVTHCPPDQLPLLQALQGRPGTAQELWLLPTPEGAGLWLQATSRPIYSATGMLEGAVVVYRDVTGQKAGESERTRLIADLQKALAEIKTLRGILPMCAWCKNIRDDTGYWEQLEIYLRLHSEAEFTHSICPACATKLRADYAHRS